MFRHTMQTCALLLGLVMLAGARECRPFPPDETSSSECCECFKEAMQRQEAEAERRAQEALRMHERTATDLRDALQLQEEKTATALQGVVRQLLQDRDEAALRRTLDERLQRMEEGARALGKPSTPSPEREDAAAAGGLASLQQLERRVEGLEASCSRLQPQLSSPQAPPATPSASTPPSTIPSIPPSPSPSSPPTTSPSASTVSSPSTALTSSSSAFTSVRPPPASAPSAHDQQTQRMRVQERIKETKAREETACAQPSSLGEALNEAANRLSLEEVQRLLDEGVVVNYTTSEGWSPLMEAAASPSASSPEVTSLLLSRGANVNAVDVDGRSALHWASFRNAPVVRLLLAAGAEVDARDEDGETPLLWAAFWNDEASVRALLAGDASRELKAWDEYWKDKTPFDVAQSDAIRNLLRT